MKIDGLGPKSVVKVDGLGPLAGRPMGDHGSVQHQLSPSWRELDQEFYRSPPGSNVKRMNPRCSS